MKGAIITALALFTFLWVIFTIHPKDVQDKGYDETYIKSITEYNRNRYEKYLGPEVTREEIPEPPYTCPFTDEEIDLLARVVMSEASRESFDVKHAIAETVINRLESDYKEFRFQNTLEDVVYTDAQWAYDQAPTAECYEAVYWAIEHNAFPDDMLWARKDYVKYGYKIEVDNNSVICFSTVTNYYAEVEE